MNLCHAGHPQTPDNVGTITHHKASYSWTYCKECRRVTARINGMKNKAKPKPPERKEPKDIRFTRQDMRNIDEAYIRMKQRYADAAEWKVENVLLADNPPSPL